MHRYWAEEPAVASLVAAFVGYKPPMQNRTRTLTDAERQKQAAELMALFGTTLPEFAPLDVEAKRREIRDRHAARRTNG